MRFFSFRRARSRGKRRGDASHRRDLADRIARTPSPGGESRLLYFPPMLSDPNSAPNSACYVIQRWTLVADRSAFYGARSPRIDAKIERPFSSRQLAPRLTTIRKFYQSGMYTRARARHVSNTFDVFQLFVIASARRLENKPSRKQFPCFPVRAEETERSIGSHGLLGTIRDTLRASCRLYDHLARRGRGFFEGYGRM